MSGASALASARRRRANGQSDPVPQQNRRVQLNEINNKNLSLANK